MKTIYGNVSDECLVVYLKKLVDRLYKILPLKEEKSNTVDVYISSLIRELIGNKEVVPVFSDSLFVIVGVLENVKNEHEHKVYRSDIFKCIALVNEMCLSLEGDE